MRLYAGMSKHFVRDAIQNQIAEKLKAAFFEQYRYNASPAEVDSWRHSLLAVSGVFQDANLMEHGVILEYQLPLCSRRLDCMISGRDSDKHDNAIIIELKQWSKTEPSDGDNEVVTWLGGTKRDVLHPSVQVGGYHQYLLDTHTAFYEEQPPIILNSCSYPVSYTHLTLPTN